MATCVTLRIAVNASIYDRRPSGLGAYTRDLVTALVRLHGDVVTFTSRPRDLPAARVIQPWGEPSRGALGHLYRLLWSQIALPVRCRTVGATILLNSLPEGPLRSTVPQVTIVHDILPLFFPKEFPRQQWYFRIFVPRVLRGSSAVIADSEQTRNDVIRVYGLDSSLVFAIVPGIDHARFAPQPRAQDTILERFGLRRYVLYVGNLLPHKNVGGLLEALARAGDGVALVIAGYRDPRYWPELARQAERLSVANRVRWLDFVPAEVLPALYGGAEAVVVPSLYEGFGLPVLEAMACGTPVVASRAGGLPEAAGDAALLVDPGDTYALAAALRQLINDEAVREKLRERGLARAAHFRWNETAKRVLEVIARVATR